MTTVDAGDGVRWPPLAWKLLTSSLVIIAAVLAVAGVRRLIALVDEYHDLAGRLNDPTVFVQPGISYAAKPEGTTFADNYVFAGLLLGFVAWLISSWRVERSTGRSPRTWWYWTGYVGVALAVLVNVVVVPNESTTRHGVEWLDASAFASAVLDQHRNVIVTTSVRLCLSVLFGIFVLTGWLFAVSPPRRTGTCCPGPIRRCRGRARN